MNYEQILSLQREDPLYAAEKLTGKSIHENNSPAAWLGIELMQVKTILLNSALNEAGDTTFSMPVEKYLKIVCGFGFTISFEEQFKDDEGRQNKYYVLFHEQLGIVLCFDTFSGNVNGGNYYYNWSPNSFNTRLTSSGGYVWQGNRKGDGHIALFNNDCTPFLFDLPTEPAWIGGSWEEFKSISEPVKVERDRITESHMKDGKRLLWSGYHDCREAVLSTITAMKAEGMFFPKWVEPYGCTWFLSYSDWKKDGTHRSETTTRRYNALPQNVKDCIGITSL